MTDRDVNERLLRLNAALDGELDAMGSLEFEREMRDDPALAAEYQRLTALARRGPSSRAARSGPASARRPHRGADRRPLRRLPASRRPPPRPRRSFRSGGARGSTAARWRWPLPSLSWALRSAPGLRRCARRRRSRRRAASGLRFRPRRNRRPAVRRRLLRPAYGQALARQPHDRQRNHRRSRAGRLPAGRRARRPSSTGFRRRRSFTGTTSTLSP